MFQYNSTPCLVPSLITEDVVQEVASKLSGSAGLGGVDSIQLKHLLLKHGKASSKLQKAVANFTGSMANESSPWAAIRALMSGRLVALDKCPGVRPLGIGESWRRLTAKQCESSPGSLAVHTNPNPPEVVTEW